MQGPISTGNIRLEDSEVDLSELVVGSVDAD